MRKNTKRSAVIAGTAAVIIGGGVAAWAFSGWGVTGSGEGTAQGAEIKPLTATFALNKAIYPGAVLTSTANIKNLNTFGVQLDGAARPATNVALDTDAVSAANSDAAVAKDAETSSKGRNCVSTVNEMLAKQNATVITASFPATPVIPAGAPGTVGTPGQVRIGNLPQSCEGVALKVTYSFTGKNVADNA